MRKGRAEYTPHETMALVRLEERLEEKVALVYRRLRMNRLTGSFCSRSFGAGEKAGRELSIHKRITDMKAQRFLIEG